MKHGQKDDNVNIGNKTCKMKLCIKRLCYIFKDKTEFFFNAFPKPLHDKQILVKFMQNRHV